MAHYTTELSNMLASYVRLLDVRTQSQSFEIVKTTIGHNIEWYKNGDKYVRNWKYETSEGMLYKNSNFDFFKMNNPNYLIDNFVYPMCLENCGELKDNVTSDSELNKQIIKKFLETFWRHFYGYEIGQENPLYWWTLFKGWYDENIDYFIQNYQQMIIKQQNYITGLSHTTGNSQAQSSGTAESLNSAIAGTADTPQNELNFGLNTGDPAKDYNFNYSSQVNGSKAHDTSSQKANSNQDDVQDMTSRNMTVAQLSNELNQFMNGIYLNLFEKAREYGLFMNVIY